MLVEILSTIHTVADGHRMQQSEVNLPLMGLRLRKYNNMELQENWDAENYSGRSANIPKLRNSCWKVCNGPVRYLKHAITKDAFIALQTPVRARKGIVISMAVYLSVCLSARISLERHVGCLPNYFVDAAYCRGSVPQPGDKIPRGRGNYGVFASHWQCTA